MRKIYLASSWRNTRQPDVVQSLRNQGHEVYDFRNPPLSEGFAWSELDPDWESWTPEEYRDQLSSRRARAGYLSDMDGLIWCDTVVLLLPCGRSAHLELGWAVGNRKATHIVIDPDSEWTPDLMYRMVDRIHISIDEMLGWAS